MSKNQAVGKSGHLRISRVSYMFVSFMKEKTSKKIFYTGFIVCSNCAGRQPFVDKCYQSEI